MGLDLVEFAMAVEEAFDLQIPDSAAGQIKTLGDVHAYVQANFGRGTNDPARSWQRIIEIAVDQFGVPAEELNRDTLLLDLAPWG